MFNKEYNKYVVNQIKDKDCEHIVGLDHNLDFLKSHKHLDTQDFIEINLDNGLIPCIDKPTRITHQSATLIDNIIISHRLMTNQICKVLITDISDHFPSLAILNGNYLEKKPRPIVKTRNLDETKINMIRTVLDRHDWDLELE